jgi:small subunit ribosomal protein S20
MPIIKSAVKKMRQDKRRYAQNLRTKRAVRIAVKAFELKPTFSSLRAAQSALDTAVKKHVLTKAAAARRVSHLSATAKAAGVKITPVKQPPKASAAQSTAKPTQPTAKRAIKTSPKPAAKKPVGAKSTTARATRPKTPAQAKPKTTAKTKS